MIKKTGNWIGNNITGVIISTLIITLGTVLTIMLNGLRSDTKEIQTLIVNHVTTTSSHEYRIEKLEHQMDLVNTKIDTLTDRQYKGFSQLQIKIYKLNDNFTPVRR